MRKVFLIIGLVLLIIVVNISYNFYKGNKLDEEDYINIGAASDLRFAFEEMGELFEHKTGTKVIFQFGSSGNIAQQIAHGAPIDLFASANRHFVEDLISKDILIEETKAIYGIGRIVLAINKKENIKGNNLQDLLTETHKIAIANPSHAPYGLAAKEALESLGLWDQLEEKFVYGENISQAMQFVQSGNAPVGIIALSIANVPEIEYTIIDDKLHNPLVQMLAVVKDSPKREEAIAFANLVKSAEGRLIMEKYGFKIPEEME